MRKLLLGLAVPPPDGVLPLYKTLAGVLYYFAKPRMCPQQLLRLLPVEADYMSRKTRWGKNDVPGYEIWGNERKVQIKGVMGPKEIVEGECEDLVLVLARRLVRAGIPIGSLRVVVVMLPDGITGHALLSISTKIGTLIWDCRRPEKFLKLEDEWFSNLAFLYASNPGEKKWRMLSIQTEE